MYCILKNMSYICGGTSDKILSFTGFNPDDSARCSNVHYSLGLFIKL